MKLARPAPSQDTPPTPIASSSRASLPAAPSFSTRDIQLTRRQIERIEAYEGLIGEVHDREIVAMAEVSPSMVLQYRRSHNIPAAWAPLGRPEAPAPTLLAPPAPPPPRAESGPHAYAVHVCVGEQESEYAFFTEDLIAAATRAATVLVTWPSGGRLSAVRTHRPRSDSKLTLPSF